MDIDDISAEGVDGGDLAPVDEGAGIASPRSVEEYARERGWKPREEWSGRGEWKDAEPFLSDIFDRSKESGKELREVKTTLDRMARTQAEIMAQSIERARKEERDYWQGQLNSAVEEGDQGKAMEASQKIAEIAAAPVRSPDNPVERFKAENPWFVTDAAAQAVAVATAGEVAKRNGSVDEQLAAAKEAVLKRFPEYGPTPATPTPEPAKTIEVNQPARTAATNTNRKKGFADLPAEAQHAARALVARGILKNVDGYVHQYFNPDGAIE